MRRVIVLALSGALLFSAFPVQVLAATQLEMTEESESFLILCEKATCVYRTASLESNALNVILKGQVLKARECALDSKFYEISYGSSHAYVYRSDFCTGEAIENYVKANRVNYDCIVHVEKDSNLVSVESEESLANALAGEDYTFVESENEKYYLVTFDGKQAYIAKENASLKINVKLLCFASAAKVKSGESVGESMIQFAQQFLGNPYVWGGTSLVNGTDCSGFTMNVYKNFGVKLPRCSWEQAKCGIEVAPEDLQVGDLVFYNRNGKIGHVAIYAGNGKIIHAKGSKYGIVMDDVYYRTPVCMRRVI